MTRFLATLTVALAFAITARADEPAIGHMVYFELKDKSPEVQKKLVDACYKYLKNHDGVLYFSAGTRAKDVKEGVSASDWDVALHIVFKDKKSLQKYGPHADHQKFIAENKDNWKGVKVYDSEIDADRK
ncbi:MAG TPA: Dabb family protein [Gemmataceae bacterium]|nr:Dabb family protein [Gemmataceae bacterium]